MLKIFQSVEEFQDRNQEEDIENKRQAVLGIIKQVREKGDQALFELTKQFDGVELTHLRLTEEQIKLVKR